MKRTLVFWLMLFFIGTVFVPVYSQTGERTIHTFENWEYVTNETGLTLLSYNGNERTPEIPSEIYGIAVTSLGESIFRNNNALEKISVPNSVRTIGRYAFQGCTSLREVQLPINLTGIDMGTFRYCTSLAGIELPQTLKTIGSDAFSGCTALESIAIPDSVNLMYTSAFEGCTSLKDVSVSRNLEYMEADCFKGTPWLDSQTQEYLLVGNSILLRWNGTDSIADIPSGVTMITEAFSGNMYVESVKIPESVTRIGPNAFRDAVNLKNVVIPDTVTRIDADAFNGCRSLRNITLPNSLTAIGPSAFRYCEKISQIELPSKLTTVNAYVLADCGQLVDVVVPPSVTTIHPMAFSESPQVRLRVTYDSAGEVFARDSLLPYTYYLQQNKDFIFSRNDSGIQILKYIGNLFDVDIPREINGVPVNRINTAAFQNNQIARRVTIPDTVTSIGDWAFSYMDSLESVQLPENLASLGDDAFTGSRKLSEMILPGGLETIGLEPFEGIEDLRIYAPDGSRTKELLEGMGYTVISSGETGAGGSGSDQQKETPAPGSSDPADVEPVTEAASGQATETLIPTAPAETPAAAPTETLAAAPTEIPAAAPAGTPAALPSETPAPLDTIFIEDGCEEVTADMLKNAAPEVTVIIPDSVIKISDDILSGHVLTIVSGTGTEAEAFARKWDIKFLISEWYDPDREQTENAR